MIMLAIIMMPANLNAGAAASTSGSQGIIVCCLSGSTAAIDGLFFIGDRLTVANAKDEHRNDSNLLDTFIWVSVTLSTEFPGIMTGRNRSIRTGTNPRLRGGDRCDSDYCYIVSDRSAQHSSGSEVVREQVNPDSAAGSDQ